MSIEWLDITCPCCDSAFDATLGSLSGQVTTDFNVPPRGVLGVKGDIRSCPSCGFSGGMQDFIIDNYPENAPTALPDTIKKRVHRSISPQVKRRKTPIPRYRSYSYAASIKTWRGAEWYEVGHLYLGAAQACCTRFSMNRHMMKKEEKYRLEAIGCFERAWKENQLREKDLAYYAYLVGELHRRVSLYRDGPHRPSHEASRWFSRVETKARGFKNRQWLVDLANQQAVYPLEFISLDVLKKHWTEEAISFASPGTLI